MSTFSSMGLYEGFEPWREQPGELEDEFFFNTEPPCTECGALTAVCGYDADFRPYSHIRQET